MASRGHSMILIEEAINDEVFFCDNYNLGIHATFDLNRKGRKQDIKGSNLRQKLRVIEKKLFLQPVFEK